MYKNKCIRGTVKSGEDARGLYTIPLNKRIFSSTLNITIRFM